MKIAFWEFIKKTFGKDGIFSDGTEGHAFLIGITETVAFWKPRHDCPPDYMANGNPFKEYHYYGFGRAMGVIFWLFVIVPCFCLVMKAIW